jgi:hypothetical protein
VTRFARRQLVIVSTETQDLVASLVAASGGSLTRVRSLQSQRGDEALTRLLHSGWLGRHGQSVTTTTATRLRRAFAARFPDGVVLDATSGAVPNSFGSAQQLGFTLAELGALAAGAWLSRRRGLRAAAYAPAGVAQMVFVAAPTADPVRFADFERLVFWCSASATQQPNARPAQ